MPKSLSLVITGLLLLSSCSIFSASFVPYDYPLTDTDMHETSETIVYVKPGDYGKSYDDVFRSHPDAARRTRNMPSTGERKMLVIPVDFPDYKAEKIGDGEENSLTVLQNAFFGKEEKNQWESVASFYHKSSYGKLNISGKVTPWFTTNEWYDSLKYITGRGKVTYSERILRQAVDWYKQNNDDIQDYDTDQDGYVDAVYLVYAPPYIDSDSLFWAYSSFNLGNAGSISSPIANAYAWSSYDFLNTFLSKGDSHTYIHETGHLLGVDDYYNTSYNVELARGESDEEKYQYTNGPTGRVDMMDYSLGDHSAYTKMLLGWTRPYSIRGEGELTLAPFVSSGDVAIIADDWNGNATDEYLALEFYVPYGLNTSDASSVFRKNKLMTDYGLKIYHVDARVGFYNTVSNNFLGYETSLSVGQIEALKPISYMKVANTNTYGTTEAGNILYHLLENGEKKTFLTGAIATNRTLWKSGDSFGLEEGNFLDFRFHDGSTLPYGFNVKKMNNYGVTLQFVRK